MKVKSPVNNIQFLSGGGEMGKLTREKDWSKTSLGSSQHWQQSLQTTLSIILNSKFPMFLFWGNDLICFYNDAYRPSLGKEGKHPTILGMKGEDAWAEIWPIIKPLIDQVLTDKEATWSEDQLIPIYRNGKIEDVYWTFSYSPVIDESGHPAGVFVTCTETTEKVITNNKLEESKNQLEFAIEATELGTWDYNPLTNKFTSNSRVKTWFGLLGHEQIELTHAVNAMLETDKQRVTEAIQHALAFSSGGKYDIEYTIVHPVTKKETIVHAKGKAWFNDEKIATRFNGTLEDITEQAIARKTIEESEQRFRNLIYASPSAIGILYGEDLKITIANEPIIAIWGKGKEIIGQSYFEALPELAEQGYKEVFAQVYKTGIPFNAVETPVHILQNGITTLKYYNFILYPMRNINNEVDGIGIIATEVTSQALLNNQVKESEQQFRELSILLEQKVKERTAELNENNIQLQKTNKELESFAYISSHDLQEPLRKIQTFATLIVEKEENNLSEHGKYNFKRMQEAAKRMQTLINDLLAYSRTNTADRHYETTDLHKIINEVKEDLKEELKAKQATIEVIELCDADIIPFQFRQLMHNIIGNALKFSNPGTPPHIKIKSKIEAGVKFNNPKLLPQIKYCHITITDNGIGFEQRYSEKIFEVFQRLHSKTEYDGTGIGLSIVKKIVENHEGIITATSELNKGASFDIYLPAS